MIEFEIAGAPGQPTSYYRSGKLDAFGQLHVARKLAPLLTKVAPPVAATADGQSISGTLTIRDQLYDLDVTLPFMLRMFEGRIKKAIEEQAGRMLQ